MTVWRIVVGLSLIPAFGTLYQRLTLPESTRFIASQKTDEEALEDLKKTNTADGSGEVKSLSSSSDAVGADRTAQIVKEKAHFKEFLQYFSQWRHAKILLGTCSCWFLLDIAYVPLLSNLSFLTWLIC